MAKMGWINPGKYTHKALHRRALLAKANRLADRMAADTMRKAAAIDEAIAEMETESANKILPPQREFEFIQKDDNTMDEITKQQKEFEALAKGHTAINNQYRDAPGDDLRKRQLNSLERDKAFSELHRTERKYRPLPPS